MPTQPDNPPDRYVEYDHEIDLTDYIRVLIKRKWLIVIGTLLCLVIGMIYSRVKKPSFEAQASLLVIPPPYKNELSPPTFSMDVYEALAKAQDLKQAIIDSIGLKDREGKTLSITAIDEILKTELVQATPQPQTGPGSSLMNLIVTAVDTALLPPVKIANAWAELFVKKNGGINSQETGGSYEFISEQYQIARENLEAAEDSLIAFNRRNNVEVLKTDLAPMSAKLSEYQTNVVNTRLDLNTQEETLRALEKQLSVMETPDGQWVGELDVEGAGSIDRMGLDEDQRRILDTIVKTREAYKKAQEEVNVFADAHDLDLVGDKIKAGRAALVSYLNELSQLNVDGASVSQALKELSANEVVGKTSSGPIVQTLPPEALREFMSLRLGYNLLTPRQQYLVSEATRVKGEMDSLEVVFSKDSMTLAQLKDKLATVTQLYQDLNKHYRETRGQLDQAKLAINALRPKLAYLDSERARLQDKDEALTAKIANLELERSRLNRNIEVYKTTFNKFAALMENAREAKANQTSDMKVVARAVEPTRQSSKVPIAIVAAAVGLMGTVFLAFFVDYVEKARERIEEG